MESRKNIQILVALKHMGNITKKVEEYPFVLEHVPRTGRELIAEAVRTCIRAYRERGELAEHPIPLTDEQYHGMREIGKFAFGGHWNGAAIDEAKAIRTAMEAVEDGLVRIFHGNSEFTDLDGELTVAGNDVFTFVRLTMLSGRMW